MKNLLQIYKASPVRPDEPIADLLLEFTKTIPEQLTLADARLQYAHDGKLLAAHLRRVLPGGTLDTLLVELLAAKVSLLRVPVPRSEP